MYLIDIKASTVSSPENERKISATILPKPFYLRSCLQKLDPLVTLC